MRVVAGNRPEAEVIYSWAGRTQGKTWRRTELVDVEKSWDDLRVGAKD